MNGPCFICYRFPYKKISFTKLKLTKYNLCSIVIRNYSTFYNRVSKYFISSLAASQSISSESSKLVILKPPYKLCFDGILKFD